MRPDAIPTRCTDAHLTRTHPDGNADDAQHHRILATLAAPSLNDLRLNSARTAAVNDFFHAICRAERGHQTQRRRKPLQEPRCAVMPPCHRRAVVCWLCGLRQHGSGRTPQLDPGEEILQVAQPWRSSTIRSNRDSFSFRPFTQGVVNGTVTCCDVPRLGTRSSQYHQPHGPPSNLPA